MKRTNTAKWLESQKRWQIKVQKDGVRRTFTSSKPGRAGQREANKKADDWLEGNIVNPNVKVAELFDQWIEHIKLITSKSHWRPYECYGKNWIKPRIGQLKIGNVHEGHLQAIIDAAHAQGLARKTQSNIRTCLASFIKYARINKATTLMIDTLAVNKSAKAGERTILQPDDLKILFSKETVKWRGKPRYELYVNAFRFEVLTGLRPGEIFGMKWSDIENGVVKLQRSINVYHEITRGKNNNARRSFALTPIAKTIIDRQKEKLAELGIESEFVFPNEDGEHIRYPTYYKRWVKYRDEAGMSPASPYELRHTFVSIVKQLPDGLLKSLVGHSRNMDTYGVYAHEVSGDKQIAAEMVQSIFSRFLQ